MPVTRVAIVPHTHWDREWYEPFQTLRVRLVHLVDELLDLLERDVSYRRFLLDGQTIVVDDYLAIRPEAAPRFARLANSGRLQLGPWMVLMDEFMVSGETIVRDLQAGLTRATELGGAMRVGYLPDMFGHIAQMPQILRLAGLDHAVVWRGVPSAITRTAFDWVAPDGSRVRAEYLYGSYSNGRDLPDDAKQLIARVRGYELELGVARLPDGDLLLMNGTDHQLPQPWLGRVVAEANSMQDDYVFEITSLDDYLPRQPAVELQAWSGELRSGARANVLMGVASNRVDIHQAAAHAERAIERRAEPLNALFVEPDRYPQGLLDVAWRNLVLNSAHDSSCACSHDDVVDAVKVRYQEARHLGDALARDALTSLAGEVAAPPGATIVVNPSQSDRSGLVAVRVPGTGPLHFVDDDGVACPTQVLPDSGSTGAGFSTVVVGQKVRWVLEMMRGPEFAGAAIAAVTRTELGPDTWEFVLHGAAPGEPTVDLDATRDEVLRLAEAGATIHFRQTPAPAREVVFAPGPVPGFGWRTFTERAGVGPATAVRAGDGTLSNGHLEVTVDPRTGTFSIRTTDGLEAVGLDRLVDGGDGGDTYNYSPPTDDFAVDHPVAVRVSVVESGPVRARLCVERDFLWPEGAIGDERSCTARHDNSRKIHVSTILEVRVDERFVRVHTEFDNRSRDHRLRAHFPLPATVTGSDAECAFAVVRRGLDAEGGLQEAALPTFVSRQFVDCSDGDTGLAVLHDGLLEYEVVTTEDPDGRPDGRRSGRELALTLLRATGYLSRSEPSLRPNPAGPLLPVEGAQLQGMVVSDYALFLHRGDWREAGVHDAADAFLLPLESVRSAGAPDAHRASTSRASTGRALRVDGARVSAVLRDDRALVVRVFNASPEPSRVTVEVDDLPARGWVVDLQRQPLAPFEGGRDLRPWEIATLRLD